MSIFDRKTKAALDTALAEKAALEDRVKEYRKVQELLSKDILTMTEQSSTYKGNDYQTYEAGVVAIAAKYCGTADWGCLQTGAIVDLRSAFVLGDGIKIVHKTETKEEAARELEFAKDFMNYNELDAEMAQEIAKEAEIEGKIALRIKYEPIDGGWRTWPGMVSVRFVSWSSKKYVVEADPDDYLWYKTLTWPDSGTSKGGSFNEEEFVYKKFGGRLNNPNDAQPKILKCLTQIDRLDKALRDLREINHLYAGPVADFEMPDANQAKDLWEQVKDVNWKIKKAVVHTGVFSYKSPDPAGIEMLIKEIETNVKMISGTTGIPIHYLGLLDLLHNRATGDNTRELVAAATSRERVIWKGAFEELLVKSMEMFNKATNKSPLDPEAIGVEIPIVGHEHWQNLQNVLIPACAAGIISKDFVASQIPGVDIEEEAERREEAEDKEMERAKVDMERMRSNLMGREDEGGD